MSARMEQPRRVNMASFDRIAMEAPPAQRTGRRRARLRYRGRRRLRAFFLRRFFIIFFFISLARRERPAQHPVPSARHSVPSDAHETGGPVRAAAVVTRNAMGCRVRVATFAQRTTIIRSADVTVDDSIFSAETPHQEPRRTHYSNNQKPKFQRFVNAI